MKTITFSTAGQISEPVHVSAGSRVTLSGLGSLQYADGTLQSAKDDRVTWATWPNGSTPGFCDVLRSCVMRAVSAGAMTFEVDEQKRDEGPEGVFFQESLVTASTNPLTGVISLLASGAGIPLPIGSSIRVGALGDSTVAGSLQSSTGVTVQVGNAYTADYAPQAVGGERGGSVAWLTYLCLQSAGRMVLNHNGGVASDTSAGCLARLTYELQQLPDLMFLQMGITNDINGSVATAISKANMATAIAACQAAGVKPVLVCAYPNNTAVHGVKIRAWNEWLKHYGFVRRIPVLDLYTPVVDPASTAGNWLAANTSDGVHATCIGAQKAATSALAQLEQMGVITGLADATKFPRLGNTQFGGNAAEAPGNLLKNPLFYVDGNADGLADGWTCAAGTKTINATPGAGVVGYSQIVSVTATQQPALQQDVAITAGNRYAFCGLFRTTGCEAGNVIYSIGSCLTFGAPQRQHMAGQNFQGVDFASWTPFYIEFVPQAAATLARAIPLTLPSGAAASATFEFAMMRLVELTALDALA